MKNIYRKSPRRLRKEKKERKQERQKEKQQLEKLKKMYITKESKIMFMRRIEKSKSFQTDFKKMKSLLINPRPIEPEKKRPMENILKDYNVLKKNKDFWRI